MTAPSDWTLFVILVVGLPRMCLGSCCVEEDCGSKAKMYTSKVSTLGCKEGKLLYEGFCLNSCPASYYNNTGICTHCINTCATCVNTKCSSCRNSSHFLTLDGSCSKQCVEPLMAKNSSSPRTRLVQGRSSLEGLVEVYYNGSWGTLCDDGWNIKAAKVVCKELSLGDVVEAVVDQRRFVRGDHFKKTKIWLSEVRCEGNEHSITKCKHQGWGKNNCSHLEDVGVRCTGPDTSKKCVKSCGVGYYKKEKHCIECPLDCKTCNGSDSCLECVETRFLEGKRCVSQCAPGTYGKLETLKCEPCPQECATCVEINSVVSCVSCLTDLFLTESHKCARDCGNSDAFYPYLRLNGSYGNLHEGLLEVRYKGDWHTVCDDAFDLPDARVICRELGYGEPISFRTKGYNFARDKILVDDLRCTGNEKSFVECPQSPWFSSDCSHSEDVNLACSVPPGGPTKLRKCVSECGAGLFPSAHKTCELCNMTCATCVTSPDTCTACRKPYYLNEATCSRSCPNGMYANETMRSCLPCDSNRGCRTCYGKPDHCLSCIPPKLHNGTECVSSCGPGMYRKGHACVVNCGAMHYGDSSSGECHACPMNCRTCELLMTSLAVCKLCAVGYVLDMNKKCVNNCPPGYYSAPANLTAIGLQPTLRLTSKGTSKFSGRLEVFHDGVWGTICDDGWTSLNAKVACAQMLLGPPQVSLYRRYENFKELNISKIWLDDVVCKGDEESLSDCKHIGWGAHNCRHHENVHLQCSSPGVSSCQKQCPIGYFANGRICEPCDRKCLVCFGSRSNCSKCVEDHHLNVSGACVDICPPRHYVTSDKRCLACNWSCSTCEGSGNNCTSCLPPFFLTENKCVLKCPSEMYSRVNNSKINLINKKGPYEGVVQISHNGERGLICSWYLALREGNVICNELHMGRALKVYASPSRLDIFQMKILVKNPSCVGNESSLFDCRLDRYLAHCSYRSIVSVRCSGPDTTRMCLYSCPTNASYFIDNSGDCLPCSTTCARCAVTATNCTGCGEDMYLTWDNKCVLFCPEGTFMDASKKICRRCDLQVCRACHSEKDYCIDCVANKYVYKDSSCKTSCHRDSPYKKIGAEGIRLSGGKSGSMGRVEVFQDGDWAAVCGTGWDIKDAAVVCRELGYGDAIRAYAVYLSFSSRSRTVVNPAHCTGNEDVFSKCRKGESCYSTKKAYVQCSRASPKRHCVQSCGTGYYLLPDQKECRPCSRNCLRCNGTADRCTACNASSFLNSSSCVTSCPDGYYGNLTSKKCEPCHWKCKTCLDGWTNNRCTSCSSPYFLKNMECVDDCYSDYSLTELIKLDQSSQNVRLVNGSSSYEGVVEAYHGGQWAGFCSLTYFQANLVCQELGYEGLTKRLFKAVESSVASDITSLKWNVICIGYESRLEKCKFRSQNYCPRRRPLIGVVCSQKLLDKRVCREVRPRPCSSSVCFPQTSCVDGDGRVISKGSSFCMHCPKIYFGDGDNCTRISNSPPTVSRRTRNYLVPLGYSARLHCYANPDIFPNRYSWRKDGKLLINYPYYIPLSRARYSDAGLYTCTLRNSAGSVTITFNVSVVGPPSIISAKDVNGIVNSSVVLTCNVRSSSQWNVTWYFKGSAIDANSAHYGPGGSGNGSLRIIQASKSDAGIYTCEARSGRGAVNATLTLSITEEPGFDESAKKQELEKGQIATFTCKPSITNPPMRTSWRKNGRTLERNERITVNNQGELVIRDVSQEDCGEYYCIARNDESVVTSVGTLAIKGEPPCIHTPPQTLSLQVGMYARFYCKASGVPGPVITWKGKSKLTQGNVYEIKSVSISDVGVYICSAKSGTKETNSYAFLTVDGQHACPYIYRLPKSKSVKSGERVTFRCEGVAVPNYTITWRHKGEEIQNSSRFNVVDNNQELVILSVRTYDIGLYACVVRSPYGQQSVEASLTVDDQKIAAVAKRKSSPNKAGIAVGVLLVFLFILVLIYFLWRYRHDGSYPSDVFRDMKRKAAARFGSGSHPQILRYDTEHVLHDDDEFDSADTNPFVRS